MASRSIWSSAPSVVSSAVPLTATHLYVFSGSTTSSEMRGSLAQVPLLRAPGGGVEAEAVVVDVDPDDRRVR